MWEPCLPADTEDAVPSATTRLPDERAAHYWDAAGSLKIAYQGLLKIEQPAWDVYFAYGRDASWDGAPPMPSYWMHQLWGLPAERRLDGDALAAEMKALLSKAERSR